MKTRFQNLLNTGLSAYQIARACEEEDIRLSVPGWSKYVVEDGVLKLHYNYSCVECGRTRKKGDRVIIEADHIYPFSKILDDFNITSIDEAISCKKLWDIENGRTLCRDCHKKTETWGINQYTK